MIRIWQCVNHGRGSDEDESSLYAVDLPKSFARDASACVPKVVALRYL
jgi:hypothetical protein